MAKYNRNGNVRKTRRWGSNVGDPMLHGSSNAAVKNTAPKTGKKR